NQRIFPYRDYVINAFNSNKPFDQFTIEQLAGDLLPNATTEQRVASGFNRLNMMTREGGAQPGEYLAKYTADRVRTVSSTFLGSTAFTDWCKATEEFLTKNPTCWTTPAVSSSRDPKGSATASKAEALPQPDGSILFPGRAKKGDDQQITLTLPAGWISAVRLE